MATHRPFGVFRLIAFMTTARSKSPHERLLSRLDQLLAEARDLCDRAEELYPDCPLAGAFQTELARLTRDWLSRAETVVSTVTTGSDTTCGARAKKLRILVDSANVATLRDSQDSWRAFYRLAQPKD